MLKVTVIFQLKKEIECTGNQQILNICSVGMCYKAGSRVNQC
jgi:hypothetical protein